MREDHCHAFRIWEAHRCCFWLSVMPWAVHRAWDKPFLQLNKHLTVESPVGQHWLVSAFSDSHLCWGNSGCLLKELSRLMYPCSLQDYFLLLLTVCNSQLCTTLLTGSYIKERMVTQIASRKCHLNLIISIRNYKWKTPLYLRRSYKLCKCVWLEKNCGAIKLMCG